MHLLVLRIELLHAFIIVENELGTAMSRLLRALRRVLNHRHNSRCFRAARARQTIRTGATQGRRRILPRVAALLWELSLKGKLLLLANLTFFVHF